MAVIKRYIQLASLLVVIFFGAAGLFIVYQSVITSQVINDSLDRHLAQRLIERATLGIIKAELTTLQTWLAISSTLMLLIGIFLFIFRMKKLKK